MGLAEGQDAASLMASGYAARPGLLRSAFKHLFSARKSDWEKFDGLFDAFWLGKRVRSRSMAAGSTKAANNPSLKSMQDAGAQQGGNQSATDQVPSSDDAPSSRGGEGRMEGASRAENLAEVDFRKLADPEQVAQAHDAAAQLAKVMRTRLTRRDLARRRGYRLDLRRTIHRNISHGGVPISLVKRRRKDKPLRLIVLLDASGSMSMYTSVFLRFIHGVLDEFREAEAFLFHTRLAHVSDAMKEKDAARALDRLSLLAQGAGGGTKIGESLQTFNRWHAARVIHSRSVVMIVSDGYETGDAALLGREMARARQALPPHRLAQSDDGVGGLRAGGARHQGGAAVMSISMRRRIRSKPLRARTLSGEAMRRDEIKLFGNGSALPLPLAGEGWGGGASAETRWSRG